jgi:hypothetical protein
MGLYGSLPSIGWPGANQRHHISSIEPHFVALWRADMLGKRPQDPTSALFFPSDRICRINGDFYFNTREGTQEGPFTSREAAQREIEAYIARMQEVLRAVG